MSQKSISALLDEYRDNNCDLALALNDIKGELNLTSRRLLNKERELQKVHEENVHLKRDVAQYEAQINTWRTMFLDLVQANTKKYTEVMAKIGLAKMPQTSAAAAAATTSTDVGRPTATTTTTAQQQMPNQRIEAVRRRRHSLGSPRILPNLNEDSMENTSDISLTPKSSMPEHITARRRAESPPRKLLIRSEVKKMDEIAEKASSRSSSNESLDSIDNKENSITNGSGRASRRAAPKNLAEPKLTTKLRRN